MAALASLTLVVPPVHATTVVISCTGWWGWYWDSPTVGKIHVIAEGPPYNQCVAAGLLAGGSCDPGCVLTDTFARGEFTASFVGSADQCDVLSQIAVPWDSNETVSLAENVVVAGQGVENGIRWQLAGSFVGTSCLNYPTRGIFTFTVEQPL